MLGGENMTVASEDKILDLKEQIKEKLKDADGKQMSFFVWLCSVRVLPFLVTNGGFDFWGNEKLNYLYNVFNAIDISYAFNAFSSDVVCDYLKIKNTDPNNDSGSINAIGHAVAPAAHYAYRQATDVAHFSVHVIENSVFTAYFSVQTLLSETIKVAAEFRINETLKYLNSIIEKTNIGLGTIILNDIDCIMDNTYDGFNNNTDVYNGDWEIFQNALYAEGCGCWGNLYEDIFKSGFQVDDDCFEAPFE
ncbi:MAG: hypothetical protein LBD23_10370 [Oscillospiraceae bacterium]|jgi:hypothetical protein|nr:hypothetical protein [Oscillospiraceae bacterium]